MKRIMLRIIAAIIVLSVALIAGVPAAFAMEPAFVPSQSYAQSEFYQRLLEVELTGDPRQDIVNIALSQLWYKEGGMEGDHGGNGRVCNNFTEYGHCLGNNGSIWCTTFIWWCARQAGLDASVFPNTIWPRLITVNCPYVGYSPTASIQPGDLLFVENSGDDTPDHLALVTQVKGNEITTVEGNCGNIVCQVTYWRDTGCRTDGVCDILYIGYLNYTKDPAVPDASSLAQYALITADTQMYNQHTGGSAQGVVGAGEICPLLAVHTDSRSVQIERGGLAYWIDSSCALTGSMNEVVEMSYTTTAPIETTTAPQTTEPTGVEPSMPAEDGGFEPTPSQTEPASTQTQPTTSALQPVQGSKRPFLKTPEGELTIIIVLFLMVVVVFITLLAVSGRNDRNSRRR